MTLPSARLVATPPFPGPAPNKRPLFWIGGKWLPHLPVLVVWAAIGSTMLAVWLNASHQHLIPCAANCGETFDAMQYVNNYRLYGFKYGLVQDMATSPDPAAHPFFYTHNVNIAGILFTLLDAVGLTPFWAKQLFTLLAFGTGLFYVFLATTYHTRSRFVGIIVLLLFCTDYKYVLSFGLNALRAWHWLAIFGLLFHIGRLVLQPTSKPWLDRMAIMVLAILSFGIGYDFWVICLLMSLLILALCLPRPKRPQHFLKMGAWICVAFAFPVVLRQVQIAAVLGPYFWVMDLYYSVAIKAPILSKILPTPTISEIDRFYEAASVLRPPATLASSLGQILRTLRDMLVYVTVPTAGLLACVLVIVVGAGALTITALSASMPRRTFVGLLARRGIVGQDRAHVLGAARLLAALVLGIALGMAIFVPLSLHIYLKHQFPLIAAPLLLVKALVLAVAARAIWIWRSPRCARHWLAFAVMCFLVADHLIVQANDLRARSSMDVSWINSVSARRNATFAVSWIPSSVSIFTHNWVVGVQPGKEREIWQRLKEGKQPFHFSDYFLFGERDAKINRQTYLRPDYWLYFPTDQTTQFDHPAPVCRQDYLTTLGERLWSRNRDPVPTGEPPEISPVQGPPGRFVSIRGQLKTVGPRVERVELVARGEVQTNLTYNCQYQTYLGAYQVPLDTPAGVTTYQVRVVDTAGRKFVVGQMHFRVDAAAPAPSFPPVPPRIPQPSVEQIIAESPNLEVAQRSSEYLIFNLRTIYGRSR